MSPIMNRLIAAAVSNSPPRKKIRNVRTRKIPSMRCACRLAGCPARTVPRLAQEKRQPIDRAPSAASRSVARDDRAGAARTAELVAHAGENRPHCHFDVVIGEIRDPAVHVEGAEAIDVSFDTQDPVAQQQLAAEASGPANRGAGYVEGLRPDGAHEAVVNSRTCHAALEIPHPVADGGANPWRHCCEPSHLRGPPIIRK